MTIEGAARDYLCAHVSGCFEHLTSDGTASLASSALGRCAVLLHPRAFARGMYLAIAGKEFYESIPFNTPAQSYIQV